jgi:hypothetical protein
MPCEVTRDDGLNFREWCARCERWARICCGDATNGWYCTDCCEHPYDEARRGSDMGRLSADMGR